MIPSYSKKLNQELINLYKTKIQELSAENFALREINVKFQIENYNLQKKIRQLESTQINHEAVYLEIDDTDEDEDGDGVSEEEIKDIKLSDEITNEEYLEEYEEIKHEREQSKSPFEDDVLPIKKIKITFEEDVQHEKPLIYQIESIIDENQEISDNDANEAMVAVLEMAAKKGSLEKIKAVEGGKQKDSAFVSKMLDAVFDKVTLASSSAQGQRYQSNPSRAPRPALDANKLSLCRRAFYYRLKQEEVSEVAVAGRLKLFLNLVNNKVQNARKCLNRSDTTKLQET